MAHLALDHEIVSYFNGTARLLTAEEAYAEEAYEAERANCPDEAYERHLENLGYDEARAQEAFEASSGVGIFGSGYLM